MYLRLPSLALDTRFPAGMTGYLKCVYNDERSGVGMPSVTLQHHATQERCWMTPRWSVGTIQIFYPFLAQADALR